MAGAKNIAVSVAAIHIGEKSVAIWEQFPERGRAISHPFDIFQLLLKKQIIFVTLGVLFPTFSKRPGDILPKNLLSHFCQVDILPSKIFVYVGYIIG